MLNVCIFTLFITNNLKNAVQFQFLFLLLQKCISKYKSMYFLNELIKFLLLSVYLHLSLSIFYDFKNIILLHSVLKYEMRIFKTHFFSGSSITYCFIPLFCYIYFHSSDISIRINSIRLVIISFIFLWKVFFIPFSHLIKESQLKYLFL